MKKPPAWVAATLGLLFLLGGAGFGGWTWLEEHPQWLVDRISASLGKPLEKQSAGISFCGLAPCLRLGQVRMGEAGKAWAMDEAQARLLWWRLPLGRYLDIRAKGFLLEAKRDAQGRWQVAGMTAGKGEGEGNFPWARLDFSSVTLFVEDDLGKFPAQKIFIEEAVLRKRAFGEFFLARFSSSWVRRASLRGTMQDFTPKNIKATLEGLDTPSLFLGKWGRLGKIKGDAQVIVENGKVSGKFSLSEAAWGVGGDLPQVALAPLRGEGRWEQGELFLRLDEVRAAKDSSVPAQAFLQLGPKGGEISVQGVDVKSLASLRGALPQKDFFPKEASGWIENARLSWKGPLPPSSSFSWEARFRTLSLALPGLAFSGASGQGEGNERQAGVRLTSIAMLDAPELFAKPLAFSKASLGFSWKKEGLAQTFRIENAHLENKDLRATLHLHYENGEKARENIDLDLAVERVGLPELTRYFPQGVAKKPFARWLEQSLKAGTARDAHLVIRGPLKDFPYQHASPPGFFLRLQLEDAVLAFSPKWPRLEKITAPLVIHNESLVIGPGRGTMTGILLVPLQARIEDLAAEKGEVAISAKAKSEGALVWKLLGQSPLEAHLSGFLSRFTLTGAPQLDLAIRVPFADPEDTRAQGSLAFSGNALLSRDLPPFLDVGGALRFTEKSLESEKLTSNFLGEAADFSLKGTFDEITLKAQGKVSSQEINAFLGKPFFSGKSSWAGEVLIKEHIQARITSDLLGMEILLPSPLSKLAETKDALVLSFADGLMNLRYRKLAGEFLLAAKNPSGTLAWDWPGRLPAPSSGLLVAARLKHFDPVPWDGFFSSSGKGQGKFDLKEILLETESLDLLGRRLLLPRIHGKKQTSGWGVDVAASGIKGKALIGDKRIEAHFADFSLPEAAPEKPLSLDEKLISSLPEIRMQVDNMHLPSLVTPLVLAGGPEGNTYTIKQLSFPGLKTDFSGTLAQEQGALGGKIRFSTKNLGYFLHSLGYPGAVEKGEGRIEGAWSLPFGKEGFLPRLEARLQVDLKNGTIKKAGTGVGARFLALTSIESLPKRLGLDFGDVINGGLSFGALEGEVAIKDEAVMMQDLRLISSSVHVGLSGTVNLAQRTQNLHARVRPQVSGIVSLGAGIGGGPIAGVGAMVVQKMLGDPLSKLAALEYRITGTWENPEVSPAHLALR